MSLCLLCWYTFYLKNEILKKLLLDSFLQQIKFMIIKKKKKERTRIVFLLDIILNISILIFKKSLKIEVKLRRFFPFFLNNNTNCFFHIKMLYIFGNDYHLKREYKKVNVINDPDVRLCLYNSSLQFQPMTFREAQKLGGPLFVFSFFFSFFAIFFLCSAFLRYS